MTYTGSAGGTVNFSNTSAGKGGGGGGGGDKKEADKVKKSDVVDRYKEVTDKLDENTRAMDKASGAADRLYGPARWKQMEKVNKLIEKEIQLQNEKRKKALEYLDDDK
jgi:hypothetical protein